MAEYRTERAGRLIQELIGALIVEGSIKDHRVNPFLSITRVAVSRDFSWAEVYVSTFRSDTDLSRGVAGLQSAAGFIQARLGAALHTRQTPKLRFHEDRGIRDGCELIRKIDELVKEPPAPEPVSASPVSEHPDAAPDTL